MRNINKKYLVFGGVILVALLLIGLLFKEENIKLLGSSTNFKDGLFEPRPLTVFQFNVVVNEDNSLLVKTDPEFEFNQSYSDKDLVVSPSEDLFDGIKYVLKIYDNSNPDKPSLLGEHSFTAPEFTQRRDFLRSLPKDFGDYVINRTSERGIYVYVEVGGPDQKASEIYKLLSDNGINNSAYVIDIDYKILSPLIPGEEFLH